MSSSLSIARVDGHLALGSRAPLGDGFDIIGAVPEAADRTVYAAPAQGLEIGIWACDAGTLRLTGTSAHEYCLLLEGDLSIVDASGHEERFGPGDAFVVPLGFVGTWIMHTPLKKHFVIVAPG